MNNRGNIMLNLLFFLMALVVVVMFISPMNVFLNTAQQSDNLNCKGYIYGGNANHTLSYNSSLNGGNSGSPIACLAISLYLPYILMVFLIAGVANILANRGDFFGLGAGGQDTGGY